MAISEETFFLPPDAEGTLQNQIQQLVAEAILSGRFRAGEKMPSSRKLAAHLGVSRITVTLAYTYMTFGSIDAEFSVGAQGLEVVACLEIFGWV